MLYTMKRKMFIAYSFTFSLALMVFINISYVYADNLSDLISGAQAESGHAPPSNPPPDTDTNPVPDVPTSTIPVEYKYYYTSIEGNVYENLGSVYIKGENMKDDTKGTLGIKDVTVIAERTTNIYNKNEIRWKL